MHIYGSLPAEVYITILISLDTNVICITTDGAKVIVKLGRVIKPDQQLCYAHGIQLAVVDVIYKQKYSSSKAFNEEMSVQNDDGIFDLSFEITRNRSSYGLRRSYKESKKGGQTFRDDLLQTYMIKNKKKNIALLLNCKTRWSSLSEMII